MRESERRQGGRREGGRRERKEERGWEEREKLKTEIFTPVVTATYLSFGRDDGLQNFTHHIVV